jgi:hypothetical protein
VVHAEDARSAARRIVEQVLAERDGRTAPDAVERSSRPSRPSRSIRSTRSWSSSSTTPSRT